MTVATDDVSQRVRLVAAVLLGTPNLITGLWGFFAPHSFYDDYPGSDLAIIAAWPPFNDHLVNDRRSVSWRRVVAWSSQHGWATDGR